MKFNSDSYLLLVMQNTIYWDGTYVFDNEGYFEIECDYCFSVKAHISTLVVIELHSCCGMAARFVISNENEVVSASDIIDEYHFDLKNATATICFQDYNTNIIQI